jgi:hypothetical protein
MPAVLVDLASSSSTGVVRNILEYETEIVGEPPGLGTEYIAVASAMAQIGHVYRDGDFVDPTPAQTTPPSVPQVISDRQFFQVLAMRGAISEQEAIAAVATGTIPAAMEMFVESLPQEQQFPARMLLQGAIEFRRAHPLVKTFGAGMGWSKADIDQLWRDGSAL